MFNIMCQRPNKTILFHGSVWVICVDGVKGAGILIRPTTTNTQYEETYVSVVSHITGQPKQRFRICFIGIVRAPTYDIGDDLNISRNH